MADQSQSPAIYVHQSRVKPCPCNFPAGFYWYGGNNKESGRVLKWTLEEKSTQNEVVNKDTSRTINDRPEYDQESDTFSANEGSDESTTDDEDE